LTIPKNVIGCGPILLPVRSVKEQDPELDQWLKRGPTVLLNLGTLFAVDAADAADMAMAIRCVMEHEPQQNLRVLWKLQRHPQDADDVYDEAIRPLQGLIDEDRVRVTSWLNAEPLALLETGHIVCSIHHGGANSWFEAVR
jgi:2-acylglycerol O-acyltransferase 1